MIDDRIKKVVKRVASEALIGSKFGLRRTPVGEDIDEDDELEVALAQQRAEKAKVGGSGGGDIAEEEGEGGDAVSGEPAGARSPGGGLRKPVGRAQSRLHMASPAMAAHKEEEEEGEEEESAATDAAAKARPRGPSLEEEEAPSGSSDSSAAPASMVRGEGGRGLSVRKMQSSSAW